MSEPLKNLAQAVVAVMSEMESLPKDGVNSFQHYNYTTEAMVANTIRPLLVKNGLALIPHNISITSEQPFEKKFRVAISATYLLLHTSGESLTITLPGEGMDSLDKSTTKALTACYKYAMLQLTCAGRGEDGDAGMPNEDIGLPLKVDNSAARAAARKPAIPFTPSGAAGLDEVLFPFGKFKGKPLSAADNDYLKWFMGTLEEEIKNPNKATFKGSNTSLLNACLNEITKRAINAQEPPHPAEDEMVF